MFNYTVKSQPGVKIPTITLFLKEDGQQVIEMILIPHSLQLYEIHIGEASSSIKGRTVLIGKELLKFIFDEMVNIKKIVAFIPKHNRLTIKLAKQLMTYEGVLTNSFLHEGVMEDQYIFGINRGEL